MSMISIHAFRKFGLFIVILLVTSIDYVNPTINQQKDDTFWYNIDVNDTSIPPSTGNQKINIDINSSNILKIYYFDEQYPLDFIINGSAFVSGIYVIGAIRVTEKVDLTLNVCFINGSILQVNESSYGGDELTCVDISIVSNIIIKGRGSGRFEFFIARLEKISFGKEPDLESFDPGIIKSFSAEFGVVGYVRAYCPFLWSTNVTIISWGEEGDDISIIYRYSHQWYETSLAGVKTKSYEAFSGPNLFGVMLNVDSYSPIILIFDTHIITSQVRYRIFSPLDFSNHTEIDICPYRNMYKLISDKDTCDLSDTINFFYLFKMKANSTYLFTLYNALSEIPPLLVDYEINIFDIDSTGFLTEIGQSLYHKSLKPLNCTKMIVNTARQEKKYLLWVHTCPLPKTYWEEIVYYYNVTYKELWKHYFWRLHILPAYELIVDTKTLDSIEEIKLYKMTLEPGLFFFSFNIQTSLSSGSISIFSIQKPYEEFSFSLIRDPSSFYITVSEPSEYFLMIEPFTSPFVYYLSINYALDLQSYNQLINNIKKMNESLVPPMSYLITSRSLTEIGLERQKVFDYYYKGDASNALILSQNVVSRIDNEIWLAQIILIIVTFIGILIGIFNKKVGLGPTITFPASIILTLAAQGYNLLFILMVIITYVIMVYISARFRRGIVKRIS